MTEAPKVLYRYEDGELYDYKRPTLRLREFPVLRETPRCYVIARVWRFADPPGYAEARPEQMVLKDPGGKRYAFLTKEDALASFIVRKKSAIRHVQARLNRQVCFREEAERLRDTGTCELESDFTLFE